MAKELGITQFERKAKNILQAQEIAPEQGTQIQITLPLGERVAVQ
ncbi:MAG: hypothetical protein AAF927_00880 [Bacteroidota bacterium]